MFDEITHPKQRAFLVAYSRICDVTKAAEIAGISREIHYVWRFRDPHYAAAYKIARAVAADELEEAAYKRARFGLRELVLYEGRPVMLQRKNPETGELEERPLFKRKYSDGMVMGLLRGMNEERYGDKKKVEVSGPGGGVIPLAMQAPTWLRECSTEELHLLAKLARKASASQLGPGDANSCEVVRTIEGSITPDGGSADRRKKPKKTR